MEDLTITIDVMEHRGGSQVRVTTDLEIFPATTCTFSRSLFTMKDGRTHVGVLAYGVPPEFRGLTLLISVAMCYGDIVGGKAADRCALLTLRPSASREHARSRVVRAVVACARRCGFKRVTILRDDLPEPTVYE